MKTLSVKPVLIASKEQTNLWSYKGRRLYYNQANFNDEDETAYYRLVLISLDPNEKIEVGDKYYDEHYGLILTATTQSDHNTYHYKKVIATQDQLSPDLIQKLVAEYNNGGMQDFEIAMDCEFTSTNKGLDGFPEDNVDWWVYKPLLTNGFVTVVEKESDNFVSFLKERIDKASSLETKTAYTIVLEQYKKRISPTEYRHIVNVYCNSIINCKDLVLQ